MVLLAQLPWGALPGAEADTYLIEDRAIAVTIPLRPVARPEILREKAARRAARLLRYALAGDIDYQGDAW